jgi:hypothetical protein
MNVRASDAEREAVALPEGVEVDVQARSKLGQLKLQTSGPSGSATSGCGRRSSEP